MKNTIFCIADEVSHISDAKYSIFHVSLYGLFFNEFVLLSSNLGNMR